MKAMTAEVFRAARKVAGVAGLCAAVLVALPASAAEREFAYRTVAGDTLIGLANRFFIDPSQWKILQERNRVANPRAIPVGTQIRMPVEKMRSKPREMEVEVVRGKASGADGALLAGTRLTEGAQVTTAEDGFVTLRLADGTRVTVPSASRVQVERSRTYGDESIVETVLRLLGGRVDTTVRPQGRSDLFEIRSNRAITGVRGTRFRVAALEGGTVAAEVLEGRVGVSEESATGSLEVAGGFGTRIESGRAPLPPVRLLPAPDASNVPPLVERTLFRLPFAAVEGARSYRAQVGQDAEFRAIVSEGVFDSPEARFAGLPDGDYFARIRAVDAAGLEGLDVVRPLKLKAHPEPPFIAGPPDKAKTAASGATVSWSNSTEAATYRLQVSQGADFAKPAIDESRLAKTSVDVGSRLGKGTWQWRVASVRPDGDRGPWSDARSFSIIPEAPAPTAGKDAEGRLTFAWSAEPGQRFQFQLASDEKFSRVEVDRMLEEPKVALEEPGVGEYFFRIRAVEADGFQGPYSATQRIDVYPSPMWLLLLLLVPLL
jgi:hypothetical protein